MVKQTNRILNHLGSVCVGTDRLVAFAVTSMVGNNKAPSIGRFPGYLRPLHSSGDAESVKQKDRLPLPHVAKHDLDALGLKG